MRISRRTYACQPSTRGEEEDRGEWDRIESIETEGDEICGLIWEKEVWDPSMYADVWARNLCRACQEPVFAVCECVDVSFATQGRETREKWEEDNASGTDTERRDETEMQGGGGRQDEPPQEGNWQHES